MWFTDRRSLIVALAALAGCGFTPAFAPDGGAGVLLGAVAPDAPATRDDFALTRRLAERLGPPDAPRYRLAYTIATAASGQAITPDNATTRFSLHGTAAFRLIAIGSGAEVLASAVEGFTSWSASGTSVATRAAEDDAHLRLMRILADQIVTRLLAAAASLPQ
ncbi:MAG: LPS assembly lipoprotein LptE [Phaeovulum sp.]|uniref:LPS assembly lipoprotein LptE n=1 Tax=Phaeovulum sp. TaxID=2934796 RepID=UPI002730D834|nr:LPS assembly lipoprotein LptE [Phaeovulum sp.]MDP2063930.1 LPS assembly lipoprotein LptE [Phaeovulum sp.]